MAELFLPQRLTILLLKATLSIFLETSRSSLVSPSHIPKIDRPEYYVVPTLSCNSSMPVTNARAIHSKNSKWSTSCQNLSKLRSHLLLWYCEGIDSSNFPRCSSLLLHWVRVQLLLDSSVWQAAECGEFESSFTLLTLQLRSLYAASTGCNSANW
ncbi:hypothetical protein Mapa_014398 [Marchantia paleacea]|nr:hypothetical protein Mapa_014398 [Marchantia paleacea]